MLIPWWMKAIAAIALMAALATAWHAFTGHYVGIGRAETQAKWDTQKKVDAEMKLTAINKARVEERKAAEAQAKIDQQHIKAKQNENTALNTQLAAVRSDVRRLRSFIAVIQPGTGSSSTSTGTGSGNGTCTVQLPPEIDVGLRRFEETILRIGSEANGCADQLRACQSIVIQDRLTCNSH